MSPAPPDVLGRHTTKRWNDPVESQLFLRLASLAADDPERDELRSELVRRHRGLIVRLVRRYQDRGENMEDLTQSAYVGLLKAIDGFDLARGNSFLTYAVPMIEGELKRHFRDQCWALHVPRREQELKLAVDRGRRALLQELGRTPTVEQLADRLGMSRDEVRKGLAAGDAYTSFSLDFQAADDGLSLLDTVGEDDHAIETMVDLTAVRPHVCRLSDRQRAILLMRFYDELTQDEIAKRLGISQMHVSRLLRRTLDGLRHALAAG